MCVVLVNLVLQSANGHGLQLKANALTDDANPLLSAQNAQGHAGRQPKPSKMPPMVGDFAMVAVFLVCNLSDIPCTVMSKLPRDIILRTKQGLPQIDPKYSRLLRFLFMPLPQKGKSRRVKPRGRRQVQIQKAKERNQRFRRAN